MLTQALNEDATDRQRSVAGSSSEAVVRGCAGSTSSRLGELVNSPFDADIRSVALPALASIMLDAIMLLVDTGAAALAPLALCRLPLLLPGMCCRERPHRNNRPMSVLSLPAAIIGRLGTAPLGAVGLSTLIFVFSNLFFNFLTVCTTSSVATAAAEKDTAEVRWFVLSKPSDRCRLIKTTDHVAQ